MSAEHAAAGSSTQGWGRPLSSSSPVSERRRVSTRCVCTTARRRRPPSSASLAVRSYPTSVAQSPRAGSTCSSNLCLMGAPARRALRRSGSPTTAPTPLSSPPTRARTLAPKAAWNCADPTVPSTTRRLRTPTISTRGTACGTSSPRAPRASPFASIASIPSRSPTLCASTPGSRCKETSSPSSPAMSSRPPPSLSSRTPPPPSSSPLTPSACAPAGPPSGRQPLTNQGRARVERRCERRKGRLVSPRRVATLRPLR
mmetsp:Transcript_10722/g.35167  ORF Transcript_10722/g.35167 Transcript_10722/m.35167 type:complete len:257 (-) Transcript_10722:1166-1936(-)